MFNNISVTFEDRCWLILSFISAIVLLKTFTKLLFLRLIGIHGSKELFLSLATVLNRKPGIVLIVLSQCWVTGCSSITEGLLYIFRLSRRAQLDSSSIVECHFLSELVVVSVSLWAWGFYHGADLICFVVFHFGGATESNVICSEPAVRWESTRWSIWKEKDNLIYKGMALNLRLM